ncbi:hypothetical protein [Streptomyces sp. I05A-00742]|uniref:hypothetical protein n=1 Tax=Streptomyces sp. I05A-00742 TaxID=2732853 RepID=UPI0014886CEE|nr:hypothetical protein [Streptomyces sp. I05A-00742]
MGALLHFKAAASNRAHVLRATALLAARLPPVRRRLAAALAGLSPATAHPARRIHGGQRAPDVPLLTILPGAPDRLFEALRDGRHVHLTPPCGTPDPRAAALDHPLTTVRSAAYRRPCLVRPDGHFL